MAEHDKISLLIKSQVPFFVRNDHSQFVTFLEKYYEYLEQDGNAVKRQKTIMDLRDIDFTEDEFAEHLYDTFMKYIPKNVDCDKRLLLKHMKDFYRAKGTEKSIRFLMNALYHAKATFYYPKLDILKASDGKWYVQKSLRVDNTFVRGVSNTSISGLQHYVSSKIVGYQSHAEAIVERVERTFDHGTQVDEIVLSNINGEFINGETVRARFYTPYGDSGALIESTIFSGLINSIIVKDGGESYQVGDPVIIASNTGSGAVAFVAQVSTGNIVSIAVTAGGAGYRVGDDVLIISGGLGSGADAEINVVDLSEEYHPNTYNICATTIEMIANTYINSANWGANANFGNANSSIQHICDFWQYSNTGPAGIIFVNNSGENYTTPPSLSITPNTTILQLGTLGRMQIYDGGQNYEIGDHIEFVNVPGCNGTGAAAEVTEVDGNGIITSVRFKEQPGHIIGGAGYTMDILPACNIISVNGSGANVAPIAILGSGAVLRSDQSTIGTIERIVITSKGRNYTQNTTIDLRQSGNGKAIANVSIIKGIITYPGRWLNDDGKISSYNFLQDRDFYQNYSYVIRSKESISKYRTVLKNLTHPAGTKMFGEFLYDTLVENTVPEHNSENSNFMIWLNGTASYSNGMLKVVSQHEHELGQNVSILFFGSNASISGTYAISNSASLGINGYRFDVEINGQGEWTGETVEYRIVN